MIKQARTTLYVPMRSVQLQTYVELQEVSQSVLK